MTATPYPVWIVNVDGFPPLLLTAATRGKATYDAFLRFNEAYQCSMGEFLRICRVTRGDVAPRDGAYNYVRDNYGLDLEIGQRVEIVNEGAISGQQGEVIYPNASSTAYVHVALDAGRTARVHPMSIKILATGQVGQRMVG